ncbi:MAG: hypothetical protein IJ109_00955 [Firmicutes bacterium]|nr:hypothetical protein [Bacillota bacterium]
MNKAIPKKCILILAVLMVFCVFGVIQGKPAPAFAEEKAAALEVYCDDVLKASLSMEELEQIAADEGEKQYTYSCFNTYPTAEIIEQAEGPTVAGILETALGEPISSFDGGQLITFTASDGVEESFLMEQLFADRYYFPDFEKVVEKKGVRVLGYQGKAVSAEATSDAEEVPAVISLKEGGKCYGEEGIYDVGRLLFGQLSPTEQNHSAFVKYLATGNYTEDKQSFRGRITVWSLGQKPTQTWNPLTQTDTGNGEAEPVFTDEEIAFDRSVNASHTEGGSRYWIHFTLDGTDPDRMAQMYNYNNNSFGAAAEKINKPQVSGPGEVKIRTIVTGYGRRDSEITELRYRGYDPVDVVITGQKETAVYDGQSHTAEGYEAISSGDRAEVTPKASSVGRISGVDAGEYPMGLKESDFTVTLKENDGTRRLRVTIQDGKLTIQKAPLTITTRSGKKVYNGSALTAPGEVSGLIEGETVTLKMIGTQTDIGSSPNAYRLLWDGTAKAGNYNVTESLGTLVVTKPAVAKPTIKSLKAKGKTITVKWSKVSGVTGYEVYRALKKTGKYTRVKVINNGKTVTFKNTKLKKKKTYYYKIRAYKRAGGKIFYSSYSAVKYKKVK